jgi:hypothetical protein
MTAHLQQKGGFSYTRIAADKHKGSLDDPAAKDPVQFIDPRRPSLLIFCLLYTPCVAAIATVKRELGTRDALMVVVAQCVIAYIVAFVAYQVMAVW